VCVHCSLCVVCVHCSLVCVVIMYSVCALCIVLFIMYSVCCSLCVVCVVCSSYTVCDGVCCCVWLVHRITTQIDLQCARTHHVGSSYIVCDGESLRTNSPHICRMYICGLYLYDVYVWIVDICELTAHVIRLCVLFVHRCLFIVVCVVCSSYTVCNGEFVRIEDIFV